VLASDQLNGFGLCPGTYKVTAAVAWRAGHAGKRPYAPFGSATFTVR
jgi:hypothetical protein